MSEYECPECDGAGEVECYACDSHTDCEACDGTGLDPEKIDLPAWQAAREAFGRRHGSSWAWLSSDGEDLGRQAPDGERLALRSFARPGHEGDGPTPSVPDPRQMLLFPEVKTA